MQLHGYGIGCMLSLFGYTLWRIEWKNILSFVYNISTKVKTTFYAIHFLDFSPVLVMVLKSLLTNSTQICLLNFIF